jgi:hypothetical protein
MLSENAAALVGAGVLSVLFFPLLAVLMDRPEEEGVLATDPPPDTEAELPPR